MAESDDLLAEVKRLRQEQEDQGEVIQALLRHNNRELRSELMARFAKDPTSAAILLLIDGVRSQAEITEIVHARGLPNSSTMSVSRRFGRLAHVDHLIVMARHSATGNTYRRTMLDKALGISRDLDRAR